MPFTLIPFASLPHADGWHQIRAPESCPKFVSPTDRGCCFPSGSEIADRLAVSHAVQV